MCAFTQALTAKNWKGSNSTTAIIDPQKMSFEIRNRNVTMENAKKTFTLNVNSLMIETKFLC